MPYLPMDGLADPFPTVAQIMVAEAEIETSCDSLTDLAERRQFRRSLLARPSFSAADLPYFLAVFHLRPISRETDPGNPGRDLILYRTWDTGREVFSEGISTGKVLVMADATEDPNGLKTYWHEVPWYFRKATSAAAWTFGLRSKQYRQMANAS